MLGAIIQARMGSVRLPGKSMMPIDGKPILQHVVERAQQAISNAFIVTTPDSEAIIQWAIDHKVYYSLDRYPRNVLDSYYYCALIYGIDPVVRITADNPLIEPNVIRRVVSRYFEGGFDYVSNCRLKVTFPVGDDVEIFSFDALRRAWLEAKEPYDKEHVTPYIYHHPEIFRLHNVESEVDRSSERWTVDTPEDLARVREIYEKQK